MSIIKRFVAYWDSTTKGTKGQYEMIIRIITGAAACIAGLGFTLNVHPVIKFLSLSVATILALRAVFWLPFKRHEAQEQRHQEEIANLTKRLEANKTKVEVSAKLGDYLVKLESRIQEIK